MSFPDDRPYKIAHACMKHFSFKMFSQWSLWIAKYLFFICCIRDLELTEHFILGHPVAMITLQRRDVLWRQIPWRARHFVTKHITHVICFSQQINSYTRSSITKKSYKMASFQVSSVFVYLGQPWISTKNMCSHLACNICVWLTIRVQGFPVSLLTSLKFLRFLHHIPTKLLWKNELRYKLFAANSPASISFYGIWSFVLVIMDPNPYS